jgi:uncharacterized protein YciI
MKPEKLTVRLVPIARLRALALGAALAFASPVTAQGDARPAVVPEAESLPLFAIVYRAGPNWTAGTPMSEQGLLEHFYYMRDLHQRGRIVLAGPLGDDGGLVILRAADQAEADRVISEDPAVTGGKFVGAATPFVARFDQAAD